MRRAASLIVAAVIAFPAAAIAQEPRASLPDLEDEVMCLTCGTTLALSDSPQAERERDYIRTLIAEGLDKEEIKDRLTAQYGDDVLATPGTEGFDLAAWLLPIAAMILVAFGLIGGIRRWRRAGSSEAPPARAETAAASADRDRLRSDLESYEL